MVRIRYHIFAIDNDNGTIGLYVPQVVSLFGAEVSPFWEKGYATPEEAGEALKDVSRKGDYVIMPVYKVV
jgi:hypothetical protein